MVKLMRLGRRLYVRDKASFECLAKLGVPLISISQDMALTLKERLETSRVTASITPFSEIESEAIQKIKTRWPHPIIVTRTSLILEIPRSRKVFAQLEKLTEAVSAFYDRHCHTVVLKDRKSSTKLRRTIERTYNVNKPPVWKE